MVLKEIQALIDGLNQFVSSGANAEDYVVVLTHETYHNLIKGTDGVTLICKNDENKLPKRMCGIDIELDDRIPKEVFGYIMLREDWERAKASLDLIEEWYDSLVDNGKK